MAEKDPYYANESPELHNGGYNSDLVDPVTGHETKTGRQAEASEMYGNVADAEHYGYVNRSLKSRHIQFIALGGTIGTGLFVGIGGALTANGPLAILLGYTITGLLVFMMMTALGEMATWLPLPGAIPQFCSRYVDDALGFAVGWNNWYSCAMTLCAEISAAAFVIQFWPGAQDINVAAWISIIIVLVLCLNIFAVSIYGEAEFIFASLKIITIVGLLIMAFIVDLGGGPNHERLGFTYWKSPRQAIIPYPTDNVNWGNFISVFTVLINAAFSYGGVETVAVAAGETENPRRNIPKAVKRVFWRILFFYVLGSLAIGVLVAADDPHLLGAQEAGLPGGAQSPWVIAVQNAGIPVLPHIINAVILTSASSSANAFLYVGSRYLFALAQIRQAPRFFLKCNKAGVPVYCVLFTAVFSLLTYLSCATGGPTVVFQWFQNLVSVATLFTWCSICIAYIRFNKAMRVQGIDRNTLPYKAPFQPYFAWISFWFFLIVILFSGYSNFTTGNWSVKGFFASYISVLVFVVLLVFWKVFKRTAWKRPMDVDLMTGKAALDAEEASYVERKPRNFLERVWFWIA